MKRVMYVGICQGGGEWWVRSAKNLKSERGWDPVLWISPDCINQMATSEFPEVITQELFDAVYGSAIPEIFNRDTWSFDSELWESIQEKLPLIYNQMMRYKPFEGFSFNEREHFARNLFLQWLQVFEVLKPDLVILGEPPGAPYLYIIYHICKHRNIDTIFFVPTIMIHSTLLKESVEDEPLGIRSALFEISQTDPQFKSKLFPLRNEVKDSYESITAHEEFSHWYMEIGQDEEFEKVKLYIDQVENKIAITLLSKLKSMVINFRISKLSLYAKNLHRHFLVARKNSIEVRLREMEDPKTPEEIECEVKQKRCAQLYKDYLSLCENPDLEKPYVYYPLQYRPEVASNPTGGLYYDLILPIIMLQQALPNGWEILVKEHTTQFKPFFAGFVGRNKQDYEEISKIPKVKLVSPELSSKMLVSNAQAVGTSAGTVGLEAALNAKPALVFGYPWYLGCPGTIHATDTSIIKDVFQNPSKYSANKEEQIDWLRALSATVNPLVSDGSYHLIHPSPASIEEQTAAITEAFIKWDERKADSAQI